jgi:mannose-1-phosphate guanylyltransferase
MIALILAGGGGTRLWPVSRRATPKQIEAFVDTHSMLRVTFDRLLLQFRPEDIFVATAVNQVAIVNAQLPECHKENIISEPCRRDTASAIGYALSRIAHSRPGETFVLINSDAHVRDPETYHRAIKAAGRRAEKEQQTVLIGITPTYPETGYGYIKMGDLVAVDEESQFKLHMVERFVEKPDRATAENYLRAGNYLWNATLIVAPIERFLRLYERHLPEHAGLYTQMKDAFGSDNEAQIIEALFERLPSVSIDYGILEREANLTVLPADFGWQDIGNWRTVRDVLAADDQINVVRGNHVGIDSVGNFIHAPDNKLVATIGVSDTIVIDTGDALLICPRDRTHEVKQIVEQLKTNEKLKEYL